MTPEAFQFIDYEAVEHDAEETDEEEDKDCARFITSDDDDNGDSQDIAGFNHRSVLQEEIATAGDFLFSLAEKYMRPSGLNAPRDNAVDENRLHRQDDWETWEVPVNVGSESQCVLRILQRCMEGMYVHMIPPRSIYAPIGVIGRVYVEAKRLADVYTICRGMTGVRWWEGRKVDNLEAMKLLQRQMPPFIPEKNGWIRLKKTLYNQDVAVIRHILPRGRLEAIVVPHIPLPLKRAPQDQSSGTRRHTKPSAERVDLDAFAKSGRRLQVEGIGPTAIYRHRQRKFDSSGYLLLTLKPHEYYHTNVFPTVAEVKLFAKSVSISPEAKLKAFRCAESRQLQIGDQVTIVASEHAGRVGEVEAVLDTYVYVSLRDHSDTNLPESIQIPNHFVRRHFQIGDNVRVKAGEYAGYTGYIVKLDDHLDQMIICDSSATHLTVPYIYVEFADLNIQLASHRPNPKIIHIPQHAYVVYLDLPVVVLKGPLKGRSGVIKTVNSQGEAQVELRGSYHYRHHLPQLNLRVLAFEMEVCKWFQMGDSDDTSLHQVDGIPDNCSMLREVHVNVNQRSSTPQPDTEIRESDIFGITPEDSAPPAIPPDFWLVRLEYRDSWGNLKISVRSGGQFNDGKWDNQIGTYKGLDGANVSVFFPGKGKILVPYLYANPTYPRKKNDYVFCLSEDQYFGTRYIVWEYGGIDCSVTTYHGRHKGKVTRMVSTLDLALAS